MEEAGHAEHSPLAQFEIHRLIPLEIFGIDASFTNAALFMLISVALITWFLMAATRGQNLVPGRLQAMAEASYGLIAGAVRDNVGTEGKHYFPFVFSLFMFILFANFIGLIPHTFTVTSHIIVTFALAMFIFIAVTIIGLWRHKLHFFSLFLPHGVPIFLAPLLVPIEIIGYLTRPISLSVRLAANMLAGHTMLEVFAGFVVALGIFGFAPFLFVIAIYGLEVIVAFLQAYVFAVLTCLYLSDAINLHKH
ncbi:MAG: F0F1 ATP synthase subunit A [Alphaproteobacteria bacterium]|nr:F0F1 ATP synthase subunit A [Alphaproteobacteria bacterium]